MHVTHCCNQFRLLIPVEFDQDNGLRAISPATVTIVMDILSMWESDSSLRQLVLQCFTMMAIILQKSSPEQVLQWFYPALQSCSTQQTNCHRSNFSAKSIYLLFFNCIWEPFTPYWKRNISCREHRRRKVSRCHQMVIITSTSGL